MSSVVQLISFPASEEYTHDVSTIDKSLALIEGSQRLFRGLEVERVNTGYIFHLWKSSQPLDNKVILSHPISSATKDAIKPYLKNAKDFSGVSVSHIRIAEETEIKALTRPLTEIVWVTLRSPKNKDKMNALFKKINARYQGIVYGQVIENPILFCVLIGWDSIEAHMEAMRQLDSEGAADGRKMSELATFDIKHAKLAAYLDHDSP